MAEEERRRARRERDEVVRDARAEAERIVQGLRAEVSSTRQALERETLTAASLDEAIGRAEAEMERLPAGESVADPGPVTPRTWHLGERAHSRSGGWEGRIAALERGGKRATLEVGSMRVTVDVDDLFLSSEQEASRDQPDGAAGQTSTANALRRERANSVASSLDLRGARVEEALEALARYLDDAGLAGLGKVMIIHGHGTGALRDAVRAGASDHPLVRSLRPGQRGEGGDGATIVEL
jgi:DNA mismatch repair protein MutS2